MRKIGFAMLAIILFCSVELFAAGNALDKSKEGDWVLYQMPGGKNIFQTIVFEGIKDGKATLKITVYFDDLKIKPIAEFTKTIPAAAKEKEMTEPAFWSTHYVYRLNPEGKDVKKDADEELNINGKKLKCQVYSFKDANNEIVKNWYSTDLPFDGLAKIMIEKDTFMELADWGTKADKYPVGTEPIKTKFYSPDAKLQVFNEEQLNNFIGIGNFLVANRDKLFKVILDSSTKGIIGVEDVLKQCEKARVVYVGENHDSVVSHLLQLELIKALHAKNPKLAIGLEMFYRTEDVQKGLDDFIAGKIDEKEFVDKYYQRCWNPDWYDLYKPIFMYAKENKIKLVGLNAPGGPNKPDEDNAPRKKFFEDPIKLTPEERKWFPKEVDYRDAQHKKITMWNFRAMQEMGMLDNPEVADQLYKGQCLWDDVMAESVVDYLAKDKDSQMVVLVGCLHVAYRITSPERAVKKAKQAGFELTYKTFFPHLVTNSIATDELLRFDIADYIYYVPTQEVFEQLQAQAEAKRIKNSMDAHAAINSGRFADAEEFLQNNKDAKDPAIPKMIERVNQINDIISLAKAGKYDEANAKIAELEQIGKYKGAVAILQNQIEKAKATGKWKDYEPQPPLNPVIVLQLLNAGKVKEAEEALKKANFTDPAMNKKILSRIGEIRMMEKLAREGKCDVALKMATEMKLGGGAMYEGIATIMIEKIQKTKETGKWPE